MTKPTDAAIRAVMSHLGKKSGEIKDKPGRFNTLSKARKREIAMMGVAARQAKRKAK